MRVNKSTKIESVRNNEKIDLHYFVISYYFVLSPIKGILKAFLYTLREILEIVLIAVLVVIGVRYFLVQPFLVDGRSMEPNFHDGDYILINEISYRFKEPQRGDTVVFHSPVNKSTYFIKRIIGLPNEKVEIKKGKIYVFNDQNPEGFLISESYLPPDLKTSGDRAVVLGPDEYFVLGDNRNESFDSRQWGSLKKAEIIGSVWVRLWPLDQVKAFGKLNY